MYAPAAPVDELYTLLDKEFGRAPQQLGPIPFTFTAYYQKEMGPGLHKRYLVFEQAFRREDLAAVKLRTNEWEQQFAHAHGRTVNIDPGYLSSDKLVLASTKDFYHRIHLSDGIYAEVTLHYRAGRYRHFSWTYADYQAPELQTMLAAARAEIVRQSRRVTA